jgi:hypothetical protein
MGDLISAKIKLTRALKDASNSIALNPSLRKPMTKVLIDRGIVIAREFDRVMGNSRQELLAKVNFLSGYVQFIIEKIVAMDSSYYLPYYYQYDACGRGCPSEFDFAAFQQQYLEYGRDLLVFTYEQLTISNSNGIYPAGDPRAFMKAAELVTRWVADDVSMTLGAYANACVVAELNRLSYRIATFAYPSWPLAVVMVRQQMEDIAANLSGMSCHRY